jgi:two-component system NarL family response regulator
MDAAGAPIRAALVDDHSIIRQGLRALLTGQGIEVVGEAENGARAIELARQVQPDVMLLDIRMKDVDGLQALPQIKAVSPQTSVIILTIYANPAYLARAISSGASGYLSKEADPDQIVRAVRAAAAGDAVIDRNLLQAALTASLEQAAVLPEDEPEIDPLSERERDVLSLIVRGCANHQIAEMLSISLPTVKTHVQHILQKLHVSDRTQAALLAVRLHLVEMA